MNVLEHQMPQESPYYYDHPRFGQIFLAGLLAVTGYPDSLHPSASAQSIEELYLVPKIWMGLLAVLDTFLVYKIAEYKYNSRVAFLASILFAVMPMSWFYRRILLESLLLPFLLSSTCWHFNSRDQARNSTCRHCFLVYVWVLQFSRSLFLLRSR
jgi:hypothetical protein